MNRAPLAVTFAVWRAIFLREALDRLFDMRFAWFWLLLEPVLHIAFITFVMTIISVRTIGNADAMVWIIVGMLTFFLFRRTAVQVTHAVVSNRPFFSYRQVKPFDPAIARAVLEAVLMTIMAGIILLTAALLGRAILPADTLLVMQAVFGLWLFAVGYGLVASVLMALVPEMEHILNIAMMPLYIISGVIWPLALIPPPYRDWLMISPIAHGIELVRMGFFPLYHTAPGVSISYLFAWGVVSIFVGLALYRRFAMQLVMQ